MNIFKRIYKQPSYLVSFLIGIYLGIKYMNELDFNNIDELNKFIDIKNVTRTSNHIGNFIWLILIGIILNIIL